MRLFRQIGAVTSMNLASVPQRLGTSSVVVIGIAGVVAVMLSMLAMAVGLMDTVSGTGKPDRAIVVRTGATAEISSGMGRDQALTIIDAPHIKRGADGKPLASAETLNLVDMTMRATGTPANVTLRGVSPEGLAMRPEIRIVEGRMMQPAVHEVIVGRRARMEFEGLNIGDEVPIRNSLWKVVGVFESGDQHESEILTDSETMMSAYQRNWFNAVTVQLESPDAFAKFKEAITTNPTLTVDVKRESEFFAEQSKPLGNVLRLVAYFIGGIMAVGALFGALNTMYTAVSARTIEIATLHALGFGPVPVVISVFVEALLLALMGGAIGCVLAWLFFDGNVVSTSAGGINQIVFALSVTPAMVAVGLTWACVIGLFGGLFPAIRVARLPVATALRAT